MAKINVKQPTTPIYTHEGAPAVKTSPVNELRRSVLACLLWEDQFYESGEDIAARILRLAQEVDPVIVANLADEARHRFKLRHAPLMLLYALTLTAAGRPDGLISKTMEKVIDRADELTEFLAIYHKLGGKTLSGQVKKGLAKAFNKFDGYGLKKYDRDAAWKLRDVAFLSHVKPKDTKHALTVARLVNKDRFPEKTKAGGFAVAEALAPETFEKLKPADTWETNLSAGKDKKEYWTGALEKTAAPGFVPGSLGYMALLRNLRNMIQAGVDPDLIRRALNKRQGYRKVLPFRYVAAAKHAPQFEPELDAALIASVQASQPLPGRTIILVDVSGSMDAGLSGKSELTRMEAGAVLASIVPGDVRVFTFSYNAVEVPPRKGMAGVDAIIRSQPHGGTNLGDAIVAVNKLPHDRLIVITDEQSHQRVPQPVAKQAYMINVASYKNGVGYGGNWTHIDGFSESVLRYIYEVEGLQSQEVETDEVEA